MATMKEVEFGEIIDTYDLDGYIDGAEDDEHVRLFEGDTNLAELELEENLSCVVMGDLSVEGNITGMDEGGFLLVMGNCRAKNLLIGDPEVWVKGNLIVANGILTDYNHGRLTVEGDISAKTIIAEHALRVGGRIEGTSIDLGGFQAKDPEWRPSHPYQDAVTRPKTLFVDDAFDDGALSGQHLYNLLLKGIDPLHKR